jgi:hypothetical protein
MTSDAKPSGSKGRKPVETEPTDPPISREASTPEEVEEGRRADKESH